MAEHRQNAWRATDCCHDGDVGCVCFFTQRMCQPAQLIGMGRGVVASSVVQQSGDKGLFLMWFERRVSKEAARRGYPNSYLEV